MTEPTAEFAGRMVADAVKIIASSVGDFVPPEAQGHLLAAQRELLLAIAVILEHNQARWRGEDDGVEADAPRPPRGTRRAAPRRPSRVELD